MGEHHGKQSALRTRWSFHLLVGAAAGLGCFLTATANGQITFLNSFGSAGAGDGQFESPVGLAVGPDGTVYVVDSVRDNVQMFSSTGAFQSTFGSAGSANGQLKDAQGIAVSASGTVYVADSVNNRIETFSSTGAFQNTFGSVGSGSGELNTPDGVTVGPTGTVYVADTGNDRVETFSSSGAFLSTFGSNGAGNGLFSFPEEVAVSPTGTAYVADTGNSRVEIFSSSGAFQSAFGGSGSSNGLFSFPEGLAVGPTGTVFVADSDNNRVETFSSSGAFQSTFGGLGTGNAQFNGDSGVAIAPTGMIYVDDYGNSRVQRFFDPSSWVSGVNTFTDPTVGPTDTALEGLGLGNLGTSLTLNSSMGLAAGSLTLTYGGSLTQNGGSLTTPSLQLFTSIGQGIGGGVFNYQSGAFNVANTSISGSASDVHFNAQSFTLPAADTITQSGGSVTMTELTVAGTYNYSGGTISIPSILIQSGGVLSASGSALPFVAATESVFIEPGGLFSSTSDSAALSSGQNVILSGGGTASFNNLVLDGGSTFTQNGGTVSASGFIQVGAFPGDSSASCFIRGGALSCGELEIFGLFRATQGASINISKSVTNSGDLIVQGQMNLDGDSSVSASNVEVLGGGLLTIGSATVASTSSALAITSGGEVQLASDTAALIQGSVNNQGTLDGAGQISGTLTNGSPIFSGQVVVYETQTLRILGAGNANLAGSAINLSGGILEFTHDLTNQSGATIQGYGTLRVDGGLTNNGTLAFSGDSSVYGSLTNAAAATVHLSGQVSNDFFGAVANQGNFIIDKGASGIFFAGFSGTGPITNNGTAQFNANAVSGQITGNGYLTVGEQLTSAVLQIAAGSGQSTITSLTVNPGSTLDLTNDSLLYSYSGNPDPVSAIRFYLSSGYNGGAWNGIGIDSSAAAANHSYALGYADSVDLGNPAQLALDQIEIKYTLYGDANLDGVVNGDDFTILAANIGKPLAAWDKGDFNYDGAVNGDDFTLLVANLGKKASGGAVTLSASD